MAQQSKKKTVEYHFVDMNHPDRYKKIKVARACDFCRKRKSKCDIGIPGSGTCSNCKKSNTICIFSPVSSTAATPRKEELVLDSASLNSGIRSSLSSSSSSNKTMYQTQNPFFSMDQRGHCNYEKHDTVTYNMLASSPLHELPPYTKQTEQELFDIYFCHVHPFYSILDRYYILQALKYHAESIPTALKLAVMAVSLHFTHHHHHQQQQQQQDADIMAAAYYQHASMQLDHSPSLASLQTLFLLYKFQELITPVGSSLSTAAVSHLREIQTMINHLQRPEIDNDRAVWSVQDELVCRASWIIFIIITFSSTANDRWRNMLDCCVHRSRFPSLTETEHYDTGELNTFCNFMHLIKIALLYSQTLSLMSDQSSLFVSADHPEFAKLAQQLDAWRSNLPSRMALAITADPPVFYSAHNRNSAHDSFTFYICLIHDILDLIISIHRAPTSEFVIHAQDMNIFKKASQIYYRAHSFTVGDVQNPQFSRLAAIQGSRIVSFGLTLALQAQSHAHEQNEDGSLINVKKYYSCCLLAFQVLDDMLLSPQLYLAVQTLRAQLDAKGQLSLADKQQYEESLTTDSSNNSSALSTPGIHFDDRQQQHQREYGFTNSATTISQSNSDAYYYSNTSSQHDLNQQHNQQQQQQQQQQSHYQIQEQHWQDYNSSSYNANHNWFDHHPAQEQAVNYYTSQEGDYGHSIPITPTFEKDFGRSTSTPTIDPLTPPPVVDTDSYFALQQQLPPHHQLQLQHLRLLQQQYCSFDVAVAAAIASKGSPNFDSFNLSIQKL